MFFQFLFSRDIIYCFGELRREFKESWDNKENLLSVQNFNFIDLSVWKFFIKNIWRKLEGIWCFDALLKGRNFPVCFGRNLFSSSTVDSIARTSIIRIRTDFNSPLCVRVIEILLYFLIKKNSMKSFKVQYWGINFCASFIL